MSHINIFVELTRLKKPIGIMLLFWPCTWGLSLAYDFQHGFGKYFFYIILFFFGSVLMRSAGCIINDIIDKDFDKKVERTKNRPIASGQISVRLSLIYSAALCLLAFFVLINFNYLTILLAISSMPLAFTYPIMKRYTYWPQLFLGITFNYGLILGWTSIKGDISYIPIIFYFGAIFWTLAYDTIYGFQDIKDDEIIGVKSTSIKFKENPKRFLTLCYFIFSISFIITGVLLKFNALFYILMTIILSHLFYFQISKFDKNDAINCLKIFKSNNFFGFLVLINIIIGKLLII